MTITQRDKRLLIVLGAMALAAAVFFLISRGGGADPAVGAPAPQVVTSPTPNPSPEPPATKSGKGKKEKVELVFSGRDPFLPLILPAGTSAPTGTSTPSPSVSPAGNPPAGPGGGSSATVDGHSVVLVDVFREDSKDRAQVEVDGTVYTVSVGDTFAEDFKLDAIVGTCADFLYGDQAFTLCETAEK